MAKYTRASTTTTTDATSTSIVPTGGLTSGDNVEVMATTAGFWVNIKGGTASVKGEDCIRVPENTGTEIILHGTTLEAIREASTDAVITVAVLGR